jgi:hypothetical protein
MFGSGDLHYFQTREHEERQAVETSSHPQAKYAHAMLADHYADRVWALEEQSRRKKRSSTIASDGSRRPETGSRFRPDPV